MLIHAGMHCLQTCDTSDTSSPESRQLLSEIASASEYSGSAASLSRDEPRMVNSLITAMGALYSTSSGQSSKTLLFALHRRHPLVSFVEFMSEVYEDHTDTLLKKDTEVEQAATAQRSKTEKSNHRKHLNRNKLK
jgi:hypothetical protein